MDSCVTLLVPDDHVTMISLISIDVPRYSSRRCGRDYLEVYSTPNCTELSEGDGERFCQMKDLPPTVFSSRALSFRFVSNGLYSKKGFRLLYSFHVTSEEPPKLPVGDKWDCSVPYYNAFRRHFVCTSEVYCSDKRDLVC